MSFSDISNVELFRLFMGEKGSAAFFFFFLVCEEHHIVTDFFLSFITCCLETYCVKLSGKSKKQ